MPEQPTSLSVLSSLVPDRVLDLGRVFRVRLRVEAGAKSKKHLAELVSSGLPLPVLLEELGRDELRRACRAHGLSNEAASRGDLIVRLLEAAGLDPSRSSPPPADHHAEGLPNRGQIVRARGRQWLVEDVVLGEAKESARVVLSCLDDDDPGRALEILWDLELGAEVVEPKRQGLPNDARVDAPALFGAYLNALRWNTVSAADATRFQAPFRAGIAHMAHQLTPLMKALELPRANLFIADDVGLGKTIEAGLVLQELILRQQADFVLIACPAAIALQWQGEMRRRFGLQFEVMTKQFVAHRRERRGFGVNPWATHNRFIVSHHLLRRPEYLEPLRRHLGERAKKSLFILDEAHVAAPATRTRYAVDSEITRTIRDLAPRFDNRLFLSATPHNGHSNSFSALCEILDPIRFSRGVPIEGKTDLAPVMVRRLKRDLKKLGIDSFPDRVLVQIALTHDGARWISTCQRSDTKQPAIPTALGEAPATDVELSDLLARFTALAAPRKGAGRLAFIRLQQRLLSSPEAFAKSLEVFARALEKRGAPIAAPRQTSFDTLEDPETHGISEEAEESELEAAIADATLPLPSPNAEAVAILSSMRAKAERARRLPDAKVRALSQWIRQELCPKFGLDESAKASAAWGDRRVIIFTEWADTKRYLVDLLNEAARHTDGAEDRIGVFHGGMGDEAREDIQRAFNAAPADDPLRILVATDAAREGLNLQAHCADLFHFDLPWNPARLEQRNGRIDRALQPSKEVRCHYFLYPARTEDEVLAALVRKVGIVEEQLGSLGAVLFEDLERILERGIDEKSKGEIENVDARADGKTVEAELEASRKEGATLRADIDRALKRYESSKKLLEVSPESLAGVVDVGLRLACGSGLIDDGRTREGKARFRVPSLDRSWDNTLDSIRPARLREQSFYEWRDTPPLPVTFTPVAQLASDVEQLHLAHPVVRRILDRFLAQGLSAHDLRRVTGIISPDDSVIRVLAYARLSLFGPGAARLHDELCVVAAHWDGSPDSANTVTPYKDATTVAKARESAERLLATSPKPTGTVHTAAIALAASPLYAALWPALEAEAEARAVDAKNGLAGRARKESDDLRALLERQGRASRKWREAHQQLDLFKGASATPIAGRQKLTDEERQVLLDIEHMKRREESLAADLEREPKAIEALYDVRMTRLIPVGLVVTWPGSFT